MMCTLLMLLLLRYVSIDGRLWIGLEALFDDRRRDPSSHRTVRLCPHHVHRPSLLRMQLAAG